jgi:exopolysaccharide biosynthesis protein
MLVTFLNSKYKSPVTLPFKKGDAVKLVHEPGLPSDLQAYECGNWLVKDGVPVVRDKDEWVGVMTNHDPRTAVGIKQDGSVVLFTVDGRQPGYSAGMTGKELASYLVGLGIVNAAMLDGGASTEMIVQGRIVNRPSFKGQERPLAGGLIVIVKR